MARQEWVHEGLEVGAPPLRKCVADIPVAIDSLAGELRSHGGQALVQALLESLNLIVLVVEVVARPGIDR
jgi:hypothetical protein